MANHHYLHRLEHGRFALRLRPVRWTLRLGWESRKTANGQFHDAALFNIGVDDESAATTLVLTFKLLLRLQHLDLPRSLGTLAYHSRANHRTAELHQMAEIIASNHAHTRLVEFGNRRNVIESALAQLLQDEMISGFFILDTPKERLFRLHDGGIHQRYRLQRSVQYLVSQSGIDRKQLLDTIP